EAALRDALASLEEAVESRDAGDVAAHLAADFIGPGGLDREGARRLAAAHFLRYRDVAVVAGPYELELREGHARVRFTAVLTGGSGAALPAAARAWQVDSGWRDAGGAGEPVGLEWAAVRWAAPLSAPRGGRRPSGGDGAPPATGSSGGRPGRASCWRRGSRRRAPRAPPRCPAARPRQPPAHGRGRGLRIPPGRSGRRSGRSRCRA